MAESTAKKPHAAFNLYSRRQKALKIERLLGLEEREQPTRLLDIGTGSGGIAHYFATHPRIRCIVAAVDVLDQRVVWDGIEFHLVSDAKLPFADGTFDVVISNHVIEHVGGPLEQCLHLQEIRRVMAYQGVGYLATPNRWMVLEPHYRLPFLSWLPRSTRDRYLKLMRRGRYYDCEPLSLRQLEGYLENAGFHFINLGEAALRETVRLEMDGSILVRLLDRTPSSMLSKMQMLMPTLVYRLSPKF